MTPGLVYLVLTLEPLSNWSIQPVWPPPTMSTVTTQPSSAASSPSSTPSSDSSNNNSPTSNVSAWHELFLDYTTDRVDAHVFVCIWLCVMLPGGSSHYIYSLFSLLCYYCWRCHVVSFSAPLFSGVGSGDVSKPLLPRGSYFLSKLKRCGDEDLP